MGQKYHKNLSGADLHIPKIHASSHAAGGSDPLSLGEVLAHADLSDMDATVHDARYYTEAEIDTSLVLYYTKIELDAGQLDSRYYTESEIDTFLALYVPYSGASNNIIMGNNSITELADPINPKDAVNKSYVDKFINQENLWDLISGENELRPTSDGIGVDLGTGTLGAGAITGTSLALGAGNITLTGTITSGDITIFDATPILVFKDSNSLGSASVGFIEWRDSGGGRAGFLGNNSSGNDDLFWKNEQGGNIGIQTTGEGKVQIFATVDQNAGQIHKITEVTTATYNILASDFHISIQYTDTGTQTSTLPPIGATNQGQTYHIKDADYNASVNNITIDTTGADTIDEGATAVIVNNGASITVIANDTTNNWEIQ